MDCSINTSLSALSGDKGAATSVMSDWSETLGASSDLTNQRAARLHEDC